MGTAIIERVYLVSEVNCGDMPRDFLWGHPFLEKVDIVPGQCGDILRDFNHI